MAVIFELVVNFGDDRSAAERAVAMVAATDPIPLGEHAVALHPASLGMVRSPVDGEAHLELSVLPAGVGWGVPADAGSERRELDPGELSRLGHGLYGVLSRMDGYRAAVVGWDPEGYVDVAELRRDWSAELADGALPGLVLADDVLATLPMASGFRPFRPGFAWIPYRGENAGNGW